MSCFNLKNFGRCAGCLVLCVQILRLPKHFVIATFMAGSRCGGMENDLTTSTLRAIRRILRAADRHSRRLAGATSLTPSQVLVLQEVERCGETVPSAVAAALQFGQATVTNIVDRLVAGGLVTRQRG